MSNTIYKSLSIKNYRSIEDITIPLDIGKLILVNGDNRDKSSSNDNGSGKTSIFESIFTLLSGRTLRGDPPDRASMRGVGNTEINLIMQRGGKDYDITSYLSHKDYGNGYRILVDGEDKTPVKSQDRKKMILDILGMSLSRFLQSVLICKNFTTLSDPDKKKLFEEIIDDQVYNLGHVEASKRLSSHELKVSNLRTEIVKLEVEVETLKENLEKEKEELFGYKSQHEEIVARIDSDLKSTSDRLVGADSSVTMTQKRLDELNSVQGDISFKIDDLKKRHKRFLERSYKISSEIHVLNERMQVFERIKTSQQCDVCDSTGLDPSVYKLKIENCELLISDLKKEHEEVKSSLGDIESKKRMLEEGYTKRTGEIKAVESQLFTNRLALNEIKSEIKRLNATKLSSISELKVREDKITKLDGNILVKGGDLLELKDKLKKLDLMTKNYEFLVKVFSPLGARVEPIGRVMSFVNDRIAIYNEILNDGQPVIKISDKTYLKGGEPRPKISIEYVGSDDSYASSSKGERARVDLSVQLGLSDFALSCANDSPNLCIFDEYVDGLDPTGASLLVQVLAKRVVETNSTVFLITHNGYLRSEIDSLGKSVAERWTAVKENGITRLDMS